MISLGGPASGPPRVAIEAFQVDPVTLFLLIDSLSLVSLGCLFVSLEYISAPTPTVFATWVLGRASVAQGPIVIRKVAFGRVVHILRPEVLTRAIIAERVAPHTRLAASSLLMRVSRD